ncbi:hypothetical protein GAH_00675 [Geoglobus ahangari]|uniref:Major Facilitator Superfamily n=1 Tax=Geoglobus ahangari TaxID=113653 RepID=A0A0F7DC02_9EURY|nr:hypothetical protein [Geoglobus ahangari]AKG91986.1 hypothetical protein GAH_00675 [Geoglobus ahangari]
MKSETTGAVLVFSYGCYLLSFQNLGPVLVNFANAEGVDVFWLVNWIYVSHIAGIAFSAALLDRVVRRMELIKIMMVVLVLTVLAAAVDVRAAIVSGFLAGIIVVASGSFLARHVVPWNRGKVFAIGASLANFYYFLFLSGERLGHLVLLSTLPLLLVLLLPRFDFAYRSAHVNRDFVFYTVPVFTFYLLGGIMYGVMEPVFRENGISVHVLFYAFAILVAGYLYDRFGRKLTSIFGILFLTASFIMFPVYLQPSAYLIQLSYAFIDVFAMIIWADLSNFGSEARQYGLGMIIIASSIFFGFMLSRHVGYPVNTALSAILLTLSAFLIGTLREPLTSPEDYVRWLGRR